MSSDNKDIKIIGRIAKFPNNVQTHKAYSFMENIKIAKNKVWYIIVQKQNDQLQMVKYNLVEGVNLKQFVDKLKDFYIEKYNTNEELKSALEKLEVVGEDKFSIIKNIEPIMIEDKLLISKITEDLIILLSKEQII
jgi:hypothetical protein